MDWINTLLDAYTSRGDLMVDTKIQGTGCPTSAAQPSVECSPGGAPCDVKIVVGKGGKLRIADSS